MLQIRFVSELRKLYMKAKRVYLNQNEYEARKEIGMKEYIRLTDSVRAALDKADKYAVENDIRMNHEEIFENLWEKLNTQ